MSLIRQLWLLVLATALLALGGSLAVHLAATRDVLATQLALKNSDNAQALSIALSQQHGDVTSMDLLMAAQFDTGHYRQIRFVDEEGNVRFERSAEAGKQRAPAWFRRLARIEAPAGSAAVSDGWHPLGTIDVLSQDAFAHDELWRTALQSLVWLAFVGAVAGLVAWRVVGGIRRPLDAAVRQAQALVDGQFLTVAEPRPPELARLTQAMNTMVGRLKSLFDAQATQVESLRQQAHHDPLTGLANRRHFLHLLESSLEREDGPGECGLLLLRLRDLGEMNRVHGHDVADRAILAIAQALQIYPQQVPGCALGRLNGSDFALALPVAGVAAETAEALAEALRMTLPAFGNGVSVAIGAVEMPRGTSLGALMTAADSALAHAESRGPFAVHATQEGLALEASRGERAWRSSIVECVTPLPGVDRGRAAAYPRARLVEYPVVDAAGRVLHLECPLRLRLDAGGEFEAASNWLPHALRARLGSMVDLCAVSLALDAIEGDSVARCVNIAVASLGDSGFAPALRELLQARPALAGRLLLEVAEGAAIEQFELLQAFGRQLRPLGVRIGLEHAGERLARIERLYEAGLDYVKLDGSVSRGLAQDARAQEFVRTTLTLLRALALEVFAEAVVDGTDARVLFDCGLDGVTGPWVGQRREGAEA